MTVKLRMSVGLSTAYMRMLRWFAPLLGYERAFRMAGLAERLILIKVGDDRWRFFRP